MLKLLSIDQATLIVYCSIKQKAWQLAFDPINKQKIYEDEKERNQLLMYQVFIQNAILSGELPTMQKPKGKSADKMENEWSEFPSNMIDVVQQYDYWITLEDLFVFMDRPSVISKNYAHGRDALARLLCALIEHYALNEKDLNEYLVHKLEIVEQTLNMKLKLGDNTLKGCCREILDALPAIQNSSSDKGNSKSAI